MLLYCEATIDALSELTNQQLLLLDGQGGATVHTVIYNDHKYIYLSHPNNEIVPVPIKEVFDNYLLLSGGAAYHLKKCNTPKKLEK